MTRLVSSIGVFIIENTHLTVSRSEAKFIVYNRPHSNRDIRPIPPLIIVRPVNIVLACVFESRIRNIANVIKRKIIAIFIYNPNRLREIFVPCEFFVDRTASLSGISLRGCHILGKHDSENPISRKNDIVSPKIHASITAYNSFAYAPGGSRENASYRIDIPGGIIFF